jgi:hypothetical protein
VLDDEPEVLDDEPEVLDAEPVARERAADEDYPEDPEDHFVADDDATRDGKSEAAD